MLAGCVAACMAGCQFQHGDIVSDAPGRRDAGPDVPDSSDLPRVTLGLIGFWNFDDAPGSVLLEDTSGTNAPVPLEVITGSTMVAPTLADGILTAEMPGRLVSEQSSHLSSDCQDAGGVTLEAWLRPTLAIEGTALEPKFVVGLAKNVTSRNVAILQAAGNWVGRVRTTPALDGTPNLISTSTATSTEMTHVVITADPTSRVMYINDVAEAVGMPGPPLAWDLTYPLVVLDEYQHARQWTGSIALIALYSRALSSSEVHQNFVAGPE